LVMSGRFFQPTTIFYNQFCTSRQARPTYIDIFPPFFQRFRWEFEGITVASSSWISLPCDLPIRIFNAASESVQPRNPGESQFAMFQMIGSRLRQSDILTFWKHSDSLPH
jgi:hypothetical protein